tara:strand:- start:209 stop:388 length:180 start_codon:yes stop_codon:yes gene_type:complete
VVVALIVEEILLLVELVAVELVVLVYLLVQERQELLILEEAAVDQLETPAPLADLVVQE